MNKILKDNEFEDLYTLGKQVVKVPYLNYVDLIKKNVVDTIRDYTNQGDINDNELLDRCHEFVSADDLNDLRIKIMNKLNYESDSKENYYNAFKPIINNVIGKNTAVQKRINLVVQFPNNHEITPMHSDVEDGDSPFELTFWLPLTAVYDSKSMYCLDKNFGGSIIKLCSEKNSMVIEYSNTAE